MTAIDQLLAQVTVSSSHLSPLHPHSLLSLSFIHSHCARIVVILSHPKDSVADVRQSAESCSDKVPVASAPHFHQPFSLAMSSPSTAPLATPAAPNDTNDTQKDSSDTTEAPPVQPVFAALKATHISKKTEYRRIRCPAHRYTPLREHWEQILTPLVEYLQLQVSKCIYTYIYVGKKEDDIGTIADTRRVVSVQPTESHASNSGRKRCNTRLQSDFFISSSTIKIGFTFNLTQNFLGPLQYQDTKHWTQD